MKPSTPKGEADNSESYKCYDGCPVCRLLAKAAETGGELSGKELEEAFAMAEKELAD